MANPAEVILRTLDDHMSGDGVVRLYGGAAMILAYGLPRSTEDADLVLDENECQILIDQADFGEALARTNEALEPLGLYLSHIFDPSQVILSPSWRANCRSVDLPHLRHLRLTSLGPMDMILSKLARGDDGDFADISWLIEREAIEKDSIRRALDTALVPALLREPFQAARERLLLHFC